MKLIEVRYTKEKNDDRKNESMLQSSMLKPYLLIERMAMMWSIPSAFIPML